MGIIKTFYNVSVFIAHVFSVFSVISIGIFPMAMIISVLEFVDKTEVNWWEYLLSLYLIFLVFLGMVVGIRDEKGMKTYWI